MRYVSPKNIRVTFKFKMKNIENFEAQDIVIRLFLGSIFSLVFCTDSYRVQIYLVIYG